MNVTKISAIPRPESGKGAARRLRRAGKIPAVAYGKKLEATPIAVSPKELRQLLSSRYGRNTVIELAVEGGQTLKVLTTDYQYHPVTRDLLHADFVQIHDDEAVSVDVPFVLEGKAQGVVLGGVLQQVFQRLAVRCLPKDIPTEITHDITELGLEQQVKVRDLTLPDGVEIALRPERTLATIVAGRTQKDEEEGEGAGEAGKEGAAGAAGADAAPAPDAAKKKS